MGGLRVLRNIIQPFNVRLLFLFGAWSASAADLGRWYQAYPTPTSQSLWDVACDGSNWVAVGNAGTILVSSDATNWAAAPSGISATRALKGITFGAGTWAAVGDNGSLVTSGDAARWTNRTSGTSAGLTAITFGNGRFVVVGNGATGYSTDGSNWTFTSTGASLLAVAYGNGLFVSGGLGLLQTSPDGISWTPQLGTSDIFSVAFDGNQFLAGERFGKVFTSQDGTNWTAQGTPSSSSIRKITKLGNDWLAASGYFWRSSDLTNWTYVETGAYSSSSAGGVYAATVNAGQLVIAGEAGNILLSADLTNFVQFRKGQPLPLSAIAGLGTRRVVFGQTDLTLTSEDGYNWTQRSSGAGGYIPIQAIADEDGIAVAGSYFSAPGFGANEIRRSPDGLQWTSSHLPSSGGLYSVTHAGGLYVAVGAGGVVHTSTNGSSWTSNGIAGKPTLFGVASGGGLFVAVGPAGTNYSSPDGSTWTAANSSILKTLRSVTYGAGRFVAVGANGAAVWSDDAVIWHTASPATTANFSSVLFADNQFVAVGVGSTFNSPDGSSWTALTNAPSNLSGVAFVGGAFYVTSTANKVVYASGIPSLRLGTPIPMGNGQIHVDTFSGVDESFWLLSSSNLVNWTTRVALTNKLGSGIVTLPNNQPVEFLRLSRTALP
jgi:hypothetical protein